MVQIAFSEVGVFSGVDGGPNVLSGPTSLQFGPDGRLYVSEQNGTINAFTIDFVDGNYVATGHEVLLDGAGNEVVKSIQNHYDDGSEKAVGDPGASNSDVLNRQVTGVLVSGTAQTPVVYITSSDPAIASNGEKFLDTNSGVLTRATWNGTSWDTVDLIRGLPRSEENHANNGMTLNDDGTKLYVMVGGSTNNGAPSGFFSYTAEYALSGTLLEVDLAMLDTMTVKTDAQGGQGNTPRDYIYDLPTLDDPNIQNAPEGMSDEDAIVAGFRENFDGMDLNGPWGGNDGLNQSILPADAPLRIFAEGFRNAFDVAMDDQGNLYTVDNGSNNGLGDVPNTDGSGEAINTPNNGGVGDGEPFFNVQEGGYYGHANPTRSNQDQEWTVYNDSGAADTSLSVWTVPDISELVPNGVNIAQGYLIDPSKFATGVGQTLADLDATQQAARLLQSGIRVDHNDPASEAITVVGSSTNGVTVYDSGGQAFGGVLDGKIFVTQFNDNITLFNINDDGTGLEPIMESGPDGLFGTADDIVQDADGVLTVANGSLGVPLGNPLDVTVGPNGTLWVAEIGSGEITVLAPSDVVLPGDPDSDNDGLLNTLDPFIRDATNGQGTVIDPNQTYLWDFDADIDGNLPGPSGFGGGLTGVMVNGSTDFEAFFQEDSDLPDQIVNLDNVKFITAAGGGTTVIEEVSTGDPYQANNSGEYIFHTGVSLADTVETATFNWVIENPGDEIVGNYQQIGGYIGTGDQSNYLKVVAIKDGATTAGIQISLENNDAIAFTETLSANDVFDLGGDIVIDLVVDREGNTATPTVTYQGATGPVTLTGSAVDLAGSNVLTAIDGGWQVAGQDTGLAFGLFSSSTGEPDTPESRFQAVFKDMSITATERQIAPDAVDDNFLTGVNEPITISVAELLANDSDANPGDTITFTGVGAASNGVVTVDDNGTAGDTSDDVITYTPSTDFTGVASFDYTITDGTDTDTATVDVTVSDRVILFRVNAGGVTVAATDDGPDWSGDTADSNSPYLVVAGSNNTNGFAVAPGSSVPAEVPPVLFTTERWDQSGGTEMQYGFDVANGLYEVNLFMGNGYSGTSGAGTRVFDVEIEGSIPTNLDDLDLSAQYGHETGVLISNTVEVEDGQLNIEFLHGVENPLVNAIEIVQLAATGEDPLPVVNIVNVDQSVVEDDTTVFVSILTNTTVPIGETVTLNIEIAPITGTAAPLEDYGYTETPPLGGGTYVDTVTIVGGSSDVQIPIQIFEDDVFEGAESISVTITGVSSNAVLGSASSATITILDDDAPGGTIIAAINAGGGAVLQDGIQFTADDHFLDGTVYVDGAAGADPGVEPSFVGTIYENERYATSLSYEIPVGVGDVTVELYLAEIFATAPGARVFDVSIEGQLVLDDFDILAQNGGDPSAPLVLPIDGAFNAADFGNLDALDIDLTASVDNAKISGIVVRAVESAEPIDTVNGVPVAGDDFSSDPATPNAIVLPEGGSTTIVSNLEGGHNDRDFITVTIPEGHRLVSVLLDGYDADGANQGFLGVKFGSDFVIDPAIPALGTSPDGVVESEDLDGGYVYNTGDVGTDLLPILSTAFGFSGFDAANVTGDVTFWLNQGGDPVQTTLTFVTEPVGFAPGEVVLAVNAGGGVVDGAGYGLGDVDFEADTSGNPHETANLVATNGPGAGENTNNNGAGDPFTGLPLPDDVFTSERWSAEFGYNVDLPNGDYVVDLYFAETFVGVGSNTGGVGARKFDVSVEGNPVLDDYDLFDDGDGVLGNAVGAPLVKTIKSFDATVTDGQLNILLDSTLPDGADNAKISAFVVRAADPDADTEAPTATVQVTPPADPADPIVVTVVLADNVEVDDSTVEEGDLALSGPSAPGAVTFGYDAANNTATYSFAAPVGGWVDGLYTATLAADAVADTSANGNAEASTGLLLTLSSTSVVSIAAPADAVEDGDDGTTTDLAFAVSFDTAPGADVTVEYTVDINGVASGPFTQVIAPAGGDITVSVPNDAFNNGDEAVTVTLTGVTAGDAVLGTTTAASASVTEDDVIVATDIDGDGIDNTDDPFVIDSTNGLGTVLQKGGEITLGFDTDETDPFAPSTGLTGLQVNQAFDPSPVSADDPYGVLTSEEKVSIENGSLVVGSSDQDNFQTGNIPNNQIRDNYHAGADVSGVDRFELVSRADGSDWLNATAGGGYEQFGIQIGAGGVDSFLKLSVSDFAGNGTRAQITNNGTVVNPTGTNNERNSNIDAGFDLSQVAEYEFRLIVDKTETVTVDATDYTGSITASVTFLAENGSVLDTISFAPEAIDPASDFAAAMTGANPLTGGSGGIAYGIFITDGTSGQSVPFTASWDFLTLRALDDVSISVADVTVNENGDVDPTDVTFQVTADSTALQGDVTLSVSTNGLAAEEVTVTFVDGVADLTVQVPSDDIAFVVGQATVNLLGVVSPAGVVLGETVMAFGTIVDDDAAPVAVEDIVATAADTPVTFNPAANDTDADSDPSTLTVVAIDTTGTTGGTVVLVGGEVTVTPDAGHSGPITFGYTVADASGNSSTGSATVNVAEPANNPPVLTGPTAVEVAENADGVVAQFAATDAPTDTLTFGLEGADAGLFSIDGTGAVRFLTPPNFEAPSDTGADNVYDVTVTVSDGVNPNVTQALAVTVTNTDEEQQQADTPEDLPSTDEQGTDEIDTVTYTGSEEVGTQQTPYAMPSTIENFDATGEGTVHVKGNAGDNKIGVGAGAGDTVDLTDGGSDSVSGTESELDGTNVDGFGGDDTLVVEGTTQAKVVSVSEGSAVLGISTDGDDNTVEATVTIENLDGSNMTPEDFAVESDGTNTLITLAEPEPQYLRVQGEDLDVVQNFYTQNANNADEGQVLRLNAGQTGIATFAAGANLVPGTYIVRVGYFDENDGESTATLELGTLSDTWVWNDDATSGNGGQAHSARGRATGVVEISADDVLTLTVQAEGDEYGRVDFIEFEPFEVPVDNSPPVSPFGIADQDALEDTEFSINVANRFADPDEDVLTFAKISGPDWVTVAPDGTISGTPELGDVGTATVEVQATDPGGLTSDVVSFDITVGEVDDLPTTTGIPAQSGEIGEVFSLDIIGNFADEEDAELDFAITSGDLPDGIAFTNGVFSGTPNETGSFPITVEATDDSGQTVSATTILTITGNDPRTEVRIEAEDFDLQPDFFVESPAAASGSVIRLTVGGSGEATYAFDSSIAPGAYDVRVTYFDENDGSSTVELLAQAPGGTGFASIGSWVFDDNTGLNGGQATNIRSITIPGLVIADGTVLKIAGAVDGDEFVRIDYIDLLPAADGTNFAPDALGIDPVQLDGLGAFQVDLSDSFSDPEEDVITYTLVDGPDFVTISPDGILSGASATEGSYTVVVGATDANGSGVTVTQSFSLSVVDNNQPPTVTPLGTITLDEGQSLDRETGFADPEGQQLTYSLGANAPDWLSIDPEFGILEGSPGNADVGSIVVDVIATDPGGQMVVDQVTFVVNNVNEAPLAGTALEDQTVEGGTEFSYQLPVDAFTDADLAVDPNETLTLTATLANGDPLPAGITFDPVLGTFAGNLPALTSLDIVVTATDAAGLEATQAVTFTATEIVDDREPITIEAENFDGTFTNFYTASQSFASGGALARLNTDGATGSISDDPTNDGATGYYTAVVRYYDETDGISTATLIVDGVDIGTWQFDGVNGTAVNPGQPTGTHIQAGNIREFALDTAFEIQPDSIVTIEVVGDNGEVGRLDSLTLVPAEGPTVDLPPVFATTALDATENQVAAGQVMATDPNGDAVTYAITGGADQTAFTITEAGELTFLEAPDFETPVDDNLDGVFEVEITASANGLTTSQTVLVNVTDDNDAPFEVAPLAEQTVTVDEPVVLPDVSTVFDDQDLGNTPADALTITAEGLPDGVTLDGTTFVGTPTVPGTYAVTLTAADLSGAEATSTFNLVVGETGPSTTAAGYASITAGETNMLTSSTFTANSFVLRNDSTDGEEITEVQITMDATLIPYVAFDVPNDGDGNTPYGDSGTKDFVVDGGSGGVVVDGFTFSDATGTLFPGTQKEGGTVTLTLSLSNFAPGDTLSFSLDQDPPSIKGGNSVSASNAGAVNGLEQVGSSVKFTFDDGSERTATLFTDGSTAGAEAYADANVLAAPVLSVAGVTDPEAEVTDATQTVTITGGPANGMAKIIVVEAGAFRVTNNAPDNGYVFGEYETNKAIVKTEYVVQLDATGSYTGDVALTETPTSAGQTSENNVNYITAAIVEQRDGDANLEVTSQVSDKISLKLVDEIVDPNDLFGPDGDFDNDQIANSLDDDDDGDGINDNFDDFQFDAQNGVLLAEDQVLSTEFDTDGSPFANLFTGYLQGTTNGGDFDEGTGAVSVADGLLTVNPVNNGDTGGNNNPQDDTQLGIKNSVFTVESTVLNPVLNPGYTANSFDQVGVHVGIDSLDFLKAVVLTAGGGVEFSVRNNNVETKATGGNQPLPVAIDAFETYDVRLEVDASDPSNVTAQAFITFNDDAGNALPGASNVSFGTLFITGPLAAALADESVGVGVGLTHANGSAADPNFVAQYENFSVTGRAADEPVDLTDVDAIFEAQTDLDTSQTYADGTVGAAVLTVNAGASNIQVSNYGNNSFEVTNTGDKKIAAVFVDVRPALYPDSVFDPNGQGGDTTSKALAINSAGGTGGFVDGSGYFFAGDDPLPNNTGTGISPSNGGFRGALIKFNANSSGGFENGETVGFSGDMDPNSIAGLPKNANSTNSGGSGVDNGATNGWDVGGVAGHELIGSNFVVLFDDGTTATGQLASDGSNSGAQAQASQGVTPQSVGLTVNGTTEGNLGTYGVDVPTVIVTGDPGDTVRITLSKGFNPVTNDDNGLADLVDARLSDDDFYANNVFDSQTVDVVIGANGVFDASELFDYTNTPDGGDFNGDDVSDIAFVASVIDPNSELPIGPVTDPIYLTNQGGPVEEFVNPGIDGYFEIITTSNTSRFKIQIEDPAVANGGTNPGGNWTYVEGNGDDGLQQGTQGTGHYFWGSEAGSVSLNPPQEDSFLNYTIFIPEGEGGNYNFRLRTSRDTNDPSDQRNDAWVRIDDDAEALQVTQIDSVSNNGFVKVNGGSTGNWGYGQSIDSVHEEDPNFTAVFTLDEGFHTVTIAGRSQGFHLDFFELYKGNSPGVNASNSDFIVTGDTVPVVTSPINDVAILDSAGGTINVPNSTFTDFDGDPLTLSASIPAAIQGFVTFDPNGASFTVDPGAPLGTYSVSVTAEDDDQNTVSDTFLLTVTDQVPAGSITASIAASSDDTDQNAGGGNVNLFKNDIEVGDNGRVGGLRFTDLDLAQISNVTSATIDVSDVGGSGVINVMLQDSTSAATFSSGNGPIGRSIFTSATGTDQVSYSGGGTIDVTDLLQTFIQEKGGFSTSDDIVFILETESGTQEIGTFDDGNGATLNIEFGAGGGTGGGGGDTPEDFRIQAEDLDLNGFVTETAQGFDLIRVAGSETSGTATGTVGDITPGTYEVRVLAYDENDGAGELQLTVGDDEFNFVTLDGSQGGAVGNGGQPSNRVEFVLGQIEIEEDDDVTLTFDVDDGEFGRIDYIDFIAIDDLV